MDITQSVANVPIRLTDERWRHIIVGHPELATQRERVIETLADPDLVQSGDAGGLLAIRYYEQTPLTSKFLVVAYRETSRNDGFVLTAYFTRCHSTKRETIWTR